MTRAMLLCAGLGTRLGELSDERPKPLLPVCDHAILRYGIALLVGHGIVDIVINLHHRGDLIEDEIGAGSALGARVRYTYEDPILGTGGGLKHALALLDPHGRDEPFVSLNGKLIFELDLSALLAAHRADDRDILGTMVVRRVPNADSWGAVAVTAGNHGSARVRDILGAGEHMFCGVHVTRPSVVRRLPDGEACMVRQGYLPWLRAGAQVAAFEISSGYFAEHSTPSRYLQSNLDLVGGASLTHPPGPLSGVDSAAVVADSATICPPVRIGAGAVIGANATVGPHAVIGAGAQIAAGLTVVRSVVWAGARVVADTRDAIVTPRTVLHVGTERD